MTERITIHGIAGGGDGVGRLADGRTVFVPRTAPGDEIELAAVRMHARFARASVGRLLTPGPDRVEPPCPHYLAQQCGGCQLMHLRPSAQGAIKATIAGDALRRLGGIEAEDPPLVPALAPLRYRSKMTLAKVGPRIGYHPLGDPVGVFELTECLLVEPAVGALHRAVVPHRELLPRDTSRLVFRRDREGAMHLVVESAGAAPWRHAADLARAADLGNAVWWRRGGDEPRQVAGPSGSWPATVFEQVNPGMGSLVRAHALAALGDVSGRPVWDLYAGIGDTTRALAEQGARVESVELDQAAVALAKRLGPAGPARHAGDVARVVSRLGRPDAVITNPPRGGMSPEALDGVREAGAARIVYISCDPATLARDIRRLADHFRLAGATAFDQFPQTAHLEMVAVLEAR